MSGIVVVKVGSSIVTNDGGRADTEIISKWVKQISSLMKSASNYKFVLVTSGAVAEGFRILNFRMSERKNILKRRAAASVGQIELMRIYGMIFDQYDIGISQYVVTKNDFFDMSAKKNLMKGVNHLCRLGFVPIFNENDCIAPIGENLGNNDILGAYLSVLLSAEKYIMLTDVDGVYDDNPKKNPNSKLVCQYSFDSIGGEIKFDSTTSKISTGGMSTKIDAAHFCYKHGVDSYIANGRKDNAISDMVGGINTHTYTKFPCYKKEGLSKANEFIAFGTVFTNKDSNKWGQENAWDLLISGIERVEGDFDIGEVVAIKSSTGTLLSYGIVNYSSEDLFGIIGKSNDEICKIFPKRRGAVAILTCEDEGRKFIGKQISNSFAKGDVVKFIKDGKESFHRALSNSSGLDEDVSKWDLYSVFTPLIKDRCEKIELVSRNEKIGASLIDEKVISKIEKYINGELQIQYYGGETAYSMDKTVPLSFFQNRLKDSSLNEKINSAPTHSDYCCGSCGAKQLRHFGIFSDGATYTNVNVNFCANCGAAYTISYGEN